MAHMMAMWQHYEGSIETIDRFSPGVRHEVDSMIKANYGSTQIPAKWFELTKHRLNPDAVRYVENLFARSDL